MPMSEIVLQVSIRQRGQTGAAASRMLLVPSEQLDAVKRELRTEWREIGPASHLLVLTERPDETTGDPLPTYRPMLDDLFNLRRV